MNDILPSFLGMDLFLDIFDRIRTEPRSVSETIKVVEDCAYVGVRPQENGQRDMVA
jgi:hypothetical protein